MKILPFICLLVTCSALRDANRFRCDYRYFNNINGYLKLHTVPANWREARLRCQYEGGILASPLNEQLSLAMSWLMEVEIGLKSEIFTGIHALFSRGDFHSVEGVPLLEIPHRWAAGEPDNHNDEEQCMAMLSNGELADVSCSDTFPYVCYIKHNSSWVVNECGTVDNEYKLDNRTGSCYKFHKVPRTWSRAYMTCAAEGGHLVIINSDTEAKVVNEIFQKNPDPFSGYQAGYKTYKNVAFVGFHDWGEHGEFLTISGETLSAAGYDKFSDGQPNNLTTGEFCGAMNRELSSSNGMFDDLWCENRYAFVCEKKPYSPQCSDQY